MSDKGVRAFIIGIFVVVLLFIVLPLGDRWMIICPFHQLTGWDCSFCGGQRMTVSIMQGEWVAAFNYNPLLFCASPLILVGVVRLLFPDFANRHPRLTLAVLFTDRALLVYLIILLLWGIIRNVFNY